MEMTKKEQRQLFWNVSLTGYEKKVLKEAGFFLPEQMINIPVVYLVQLEYFGFQYTVDVLRALYWYLELPEESVDETIEELIVDYNEFRIDDEYDPDYLSGKSEIQIAISEMLYAIGYDSKKKISEITIIELLQIPGVNDTSLEFVAEEIIRSYYSTYVVPSCTYRTRDDFKLNGALLFKTLK